MNKLKVERFDARLDALLPAVPEIEQLTTGLQFCEGPVWDHRRGLLYFTDFYPLKIYTWSPDDGTELVCGESGREIGLTLDSQGRLLGCASRLHAISRRKANGTVELLRNELADGLHINNPNDLVVKSDGSIYFTDPYNSKNGIPRSAPTNGVYRLDPEKDALTLVVEHMERPNGLCFSPDESLLYVNDTGGQFINVHDVLSDGTLSEARLFATLDPSYGKGAPDGMKCDREGNIYVTGPGGIWILSPDGTPLGILYLDEYPGNLGWGGNNWDELFITASTSVYRIPMKAQGIAVGLE